jgi:hypothetical protein
MADIGRQRISEGANGRQRSAVDVRGLWWQTALGSGCQKSRMVDIVRQGMSEVPSPTHSPAGDVRGP